MKKNSRYILLTSILVFMAITIIYSNRGLIFPHITHIEEELECKTCHTGVNKSTKEKDNNLPSFSVCTEECHEEDIKKKVTITNKRPFYKLKFDHEIHIDQDVKCTTCHAGLGKKSYKPGDAFPKMSVCYKCHDNETAPKTCTLCHDGKVSFPHKLHQENDVECLDCHKTIEGSTVTDGGRDIPKRKLCSDCHDEKDKFYELIEFSYRHKFKFNHKLHITGQKLECRECHAGLYIKKKTKKAVKIPRLKKLCFRCHDNRTASRFCMLCHIKPIKPEGHYYSEFDNLRRIQANNKFMQCMNCHKNPEFCLSCHKAAKKPEQFHGSNYMITHRYESRTSLKNCYTCHSKRTCRNCHITSNASLHSGPPVNRMHPVGWLDTTSPNFHRRKARLRLAACASCHMKRDCTACHNRAVIGPRRRR